MQLCRRQPPDALPQPTLANKPGYLASNPSSSSKEKTENALDASIPVPTYDGLTLILACRSTARADKARQDLLQILEEEVSTLRKDAEYDGHAELFAKNVKVAVHRVDLAEVKSVLCLAFNMQRRRGVDNRS